MEHELDELPGRIYTENRPHDFPRNVKRQIQTNGIDLFLSLLKYQGWMMDHEWNGWKKLGTLCYGICNFALLIAVMSGGILGLSKGSDAQSQETFLITLTTVLSDVRRLLIMFALIMDANKIRRMNETLKETIEFGFYYSPGISAPIHERSRRQSYCLLIIYHLYFGAISTWWILLMPALDVYRAHPNVDYEKIELPFPHSYFGMDKKTHFCFGLLTSVCALLKGQLSILVESMRLATGSSRHVPRHDYQPMVSLFGPLLMSTRASKTATAQNEPDQRTANSIDFRKCIRHHQMILRALKELKVLMRPQIFINIHFSCAFFILVGAAETWTDAVYGRLVYGSLTLHWITQICYWTWHLSSLKAACREVGCAAFSIGTHASISSKDLAFIIKRSQYDEKFPSFLTASFDFPVLFRMLIIAWDILSVARRKL
ncbi:uncharacterized protein [Bemisia tabaci]|uniref:uncharacterized protein isoform X2 n=1 Tax=Bemisia tabaci TaxID=7038 RepID=UPI003B289E4D